MVLGLSLAKFSFIAGIALLLVSCSSCERAVNFAARDISIDDARICNRDNCGRARLKGYLGWGDSGVYIYETIAHADYNLFGDALLFSNYHKSQSMIELCGSEYVYLYGTIGNTPEHGIHIRDFGSVLKIKRTNPDGILSYEQCYE